MDQLDSCVLNEKFSKRYKKSTLNYGVKMITRIEILMTTMHALTVGLIQTHVATFQKITHSVEDGKLDVKERFGPM